MRDAKYFKIKADVVIIIFTVFCFSALAKDIQPYQQTTEEILSFDTQRLSELYNTLHDLNPKLENEIYKSLGSHDQFCKSSIKINGSTFPIHLEFDSAKTVIHIGIILFKNDAQNIPMDIRRFLERNLLQNVLLNEETALSNLETQGINIIYNNYYFGSLAFRKLSSILDPILNANYFELSENDSLFSAEWRRDSTNQIIMSFPKRQSLIAGLDKKQLGIKLIEELAAYKLDDSETKETNWIEPTNLEHLSNDLYRQKGKDIFPDINPDCYFTKDNEHYALLFDSKYPEQSTRNLFIAENDLANKVTFRLISKLYPDGIDKSLKLIKQFFEKDHHFYIGFEESSPTILKTVMIIKHKRYNHLHLLYFDFPVSFFEMKQNILMNVKFYTNIRQDNLHGIFQTSKNQNTNDRKQKYKIKIDR